jgi:hypothetical protein
MVNQEPHETGLHTFPNIIFCVYDLVENINELGCCVKFNEETISILPYTDDIALITPDEQSMQHKFSIHSPKGSTRRAS